jgi:hypothetical protein
MPMNRLPTLRAANSTLRSTLVFNGLLELDSGFTADPRYLEIVKAMGLIDLWEQRGAPDFCEKLDGQWVCE